MSLIKPMVSSKTNEWPTPLSLFRYLDGKFSFTLDPAATAENAKCSKFYTLADDGLSHSWAGERVFLNPPYGGKTRMWLEKAKNECLNGKCLVVCLIVSSTDRTYWHDIIARYASEIWFMRGRVKFGESTTTAPFASAIVVFDGKTAQTGPKISFIDCREFHQ